MNQHKSQVQPDGTCLYCGKKTQYYKDILCTQCWEHFHPPKKNNTKSS